MLVKTIKVLGALYLAYLVLIVFVAMPALNLLAPRLVQQYLHRELQTDAIVLNPFTLAAEVRGATVRENDGDFFLSFDKANVDLSLGSLLGKGLVLDAAQLLGLHLDLRRLPDGAFNFSDMLPPPSEEPEPPASDAGLPRLTIHRLDLEARRIDLSDLAREQPFRTHYDGIDIHVSGLTTVISDGEPYHFDAVAEDGGELHWQGTVSIPGARSEGQLEISRLTLEPAWRFAEPWLNFRLTDGEINLSGNYKLSWAKDFTAQISDARFLLDKLSLQPLDPNALPDTALGLRELKIAGIHVDTSTQSATADELLVDGFSVDGWSEGSRASLVDMLTPRGLGGAAADPNAPAPAPAQASPPPDPNTPAADNGWSAGLASLQLRNSAIRWRSEFTDPALMTVTPIEASAQSLHWPPTGSSPLALSLRVNDTTDLDIKGTLALDSGTGEIEYKLDKLPLAWFNPDLPEMINVTITDGGLSLGGSVALADFQPKRVKLDGAIDNYASSIKGEEQTVTSWNMRWNGLDIDFDKHAVLLQRLSVDNYDGRIHIDKDGRLNTSQILREEEKTPEQAATEAQKPTEPAGPDWTVRIPEIHLSKGTIDYFDESLPIHFRTVVGDLGGEIRNIDSTPGTQASVDIRGSVDGYAPVTLAGSVDPFGEKPDLDLALDFTGVDMATLSPYSATYAGHTIERGLLTLNLHYSLKGELLKGDNKVLIKQLKLGREVDSDKALDLPLQLALALLTDANGVIDLEVPVEGNPDDPSFALGSVIGKAFVNLLTKAVTAPFNLLASLVGSEEDLQRIGFPVGTSELGERADAKLAELADALGQRPQLTLVIFGRVNLEADREKLQEQQLQAQLLESGLDPQDIDDRTEKFVDAVEDRYRQLGADESEETSYLQRYRAVVAAIPVAEGDLLALAQRRAVAVKEHLVNDLGLPSDRAVIEQAAHLDTQKSVFSGVELDLEG